MNTSQITQSKSQWQLLVILICGSLLLVIWPLPNTMAFRNLLLLLGAGLTLHQKPWYLLKSNIKLQKHFYLLPMLFIWIVIQYLFITNEKAAQLDDIKGFWLRSLLAMLIGWGAGLALVQSTNEKTTNQRLNSAPLIFLIGLTGTLICYLIMYLLEAFKSGKWMHTDFYAKSYINKPPIVIYIGILLPAILMAFSKSKKPDGLIQNKIVATGLLLLSLFSLYTSGSKNGIALFIFIFSIFFIKKFTQEGFPKEMRIKNVLIYGVLVILCSGIFYKHYQEKSAWRNIIEDTRVAIHLDASDHWKSHEMTPLPVNENGQPVDGSVYLRVAWATAGLQLVLENPLGYGALNEAFVKQAHMKWPDFRPTDTTTNINTHAGWIDLTLAFGIPGFLLLLAALWCPVLANKKTNDWWSSYKFWYAVVITFGFAFTEIAMDYFIETYIYMGALFSIQMSNSGTTK